MLLIPQIPTRIKEWAYAGFGIVFISAATAHLASGDAAPMIITPLVVFFILIVSYIYLHRIDKVQMPEQAGHVIA